MAKVGMMMWPLAGVMNRALKIASDLRLCHHEVVFIGVPDCAPFVEVAGFTLAPIFATTFPQGFQKELHQNMQRLDGDERMRDRRARTVRLNALLTELSESGSNEVEQTLQRLDLDLLLLDGTTYFPTVVGVIAHHLGIPLAYLNGCTSCHPALGSPAFTSAQIGGTGWLARGRALLDWSMVLFRKWRFEKRELRLGLDIDRRHSLRRIAQRCGLPLDCINWWRGIDTPSLKIPCYYTLPPEFDFPGAKPVIGEFLGTVLNTERAPVAFDWNRLKPGIPLIYCSFGTLPYLSPEQTRQLLQTVLEAMKNLPNLQMVLVTGACVSPEHFPNAPQNVHLVATAPQLELLKRAQLSITHGGFNSITESIYYGVPMIVFPLGYDQPGCAARVEYHRLGRMARHEQMDSATLALLIREVLHNPVYSSAVKSLSQTFQKENSAAAIVARLEPLMRVRKSESVPVSVMA